jgi:hypothetical protein
MVDVYLQDGGRHAGAAAKLLPGWKAVTPGADSAVFLIRMRHQIDDHC